MAPRPLLALPWALVIAGCTTLAVPREVEVPFVCEDGRRFTAVFQRNPDSALLRIAGRKLLLPGTASGYKQPAHYSDGRNALYGSGVAATLEIEGLPPSQGCVRVAEPAPPRPKTPRR
jgi:hypothetical protein